MRVALFGAGAMGRHHARHLAALGVDLVVVDPAQGHHAEPQGLDAAVVAVPTARHAEVALPLLAAGIPCLVEKPLAGRLDEAEALARYPHLAVGHVERFNPVLQVLRGRSLRFVQAERLAAFTPRATDVDVVLDLMIHDLDLFLHLAGPAEVVDVRANGVAVATGSLDLAQARVELADGRVGTFTASRVSRKRARWFRAFAEGAYWSLDLDARQGAEVTWAEGLVETPLVVPQVDPLGAELEAFLAAVRGEGPFHPSGADGLRAQRLAEQVRACVS